MNEGMNLFAEALVFVHGKDAESEAARQARLCESLGFAETAETWRQLQGAVRDLTRSTACATHQAA